MARAVTRGQQKIVILYIEDVDLNDIATPADKLISVILYIEDVDLNFFVRICVSMRIWSSSTLRMWI